MSATIRAALRAAIFQALAVLGEKEARAIIAECLATTENDHWRST